MVNGGGAERVHGHTLSVKKENGGVSCVSLPVKSNLV